MKQNCKNFPVLILIYLIIQSSTSYRIGVGLGGQESSWLCIIRVLYDDEDTSNELRLLLPPPIESFKEFRLLPVTLSCLEKELNKKRLLGK